MSLSTVLKLPKTCIDRTSTDSGEARVSTHDPVHQSDHFARLELPNIRVLVSPRLAAESKAPELVEQHLRGLTNRFRWPYRKKTVLRTQPRDLKDRVYQDLALDAHIQGVRSPLPSKDSVSLRRDWVLLKSPILGSAAAGLMTASVNSNIVTCIRALSCTTRHHRLQREEFSTAVHETAHATAVNIVTRTQAGNKLSRMRAGLVVSPAESGSPIKFLVLEEVHVSSLAARALLRAGCTEESSTERYSLRVLTHRIPTYEQRAFRSLLERYEIGVVDSAGGRFLEITDYNVVDSSGSYRNGYSTWASALRVLAQEMFPTLDRQDSWNTFSKMLGRAHAGDPGAFKALMVTIKRGLGADAMQILGEITSENLLMNDALMLALAASSNLDSNTRAAFRRELLQFSRGHLMLIDSLKAERVPPVHAVVEATRYSGRLPEQLTSQAVDLARKFTIEQAPLKAYLLLSKLKIPREKWPKEIAAAIDALPAWRRIQANLMRFGSNLLASAIVRKLMSPDAVPYFYKRTFGPNC